MVDIAAVERIHIVGIGGAGMSALAKLLSGRGHRVTGSDLRWSAALADLADLGMGVWSGHRPERVAGADLVVASSAVPDTDPEVRAAMEAGIEVWHRPGLLEAITSAMPTIGPTGTHGKTSSTAMMVAGARGAGMDPSFVVGGELIDHRTNASAGTDDLLVLEVDEAFGTFEQVTLSAVMVTNVEPEHLEHFGSVADLEDAFARVVRNVDGPRLVCLDDPGGRRLAGRTDAATYGTSRGATWRMTGLAEESGSTSFRLTGGGVDVAVRVPRLGVHMARNAAGVVALLAEYGLDPSAVSEGIARHGGVRRRFELRGTVAGVSLIDDYAHHPTEIGATLREARALGRGRVVAVFQPHLYSRTEHLQSEFGAALALADRVIVTDVFGSRETPVPGVTGALVADAAVRAGAALTDYVPHLVDLPARVAGVVEDGDRVVLMGAGDITAVAPEILASIEGRSR
jgi:UDP-N-acetylmuramate--alanine ligase